MNLENFLTSGHHFRKNQYEEKLHYYLFNSILSIVIIMLSFFTYIRISNHENIQAYIDLSIVLISIFCIYFLRKSKKYEQLITYILLVAFFILVSETFLRKNSHLVGTSWYIVFLMFVYFLSNKKLGIFTTIISFFTIIILGQFTIREYTFVEYFYILMPFVIGVVFIILYEKRNLYTKKLLLKKNTSLETEVENKIKEKMKLSEQSKELIEIIEKSNIELYIVDFETDQYTYVNNGAIYESGYTKEELLTMSIYDLNPNLTLKDALKFKKEIEESKTKSISIISKHKRRNGNEYAVQAYIHKLRFNNKDAYVIYDINISEKEKAQKELLEQRDAFHHQAHHDVLTNLPNRALLMDRITQAIYKAQRNNKQFAILFIDLDQFKQINDSLGHEIGDLVIKQVAVRFTKILRKEDTFARLGGDEFTILMEDIKSSSDAAVLAQKLLKNTQKPFLIKKHELYITCSIGVSLYPQDAKQVNLLLRNADAAMYRAKERGRNTFDFYTKDMTKSAFERVIMETSLRHAISENEFVVYYQPQYNIKTDTIIGVEALARWQHPQIGLIQPASFLPLAQEIGMIVKIDKLIAKKAMLQFAKWRQNGINLKKLSLNLTVQQLMENNFIDEVKENLSKINFNPKWLRFEITESQIMTNPEVAIDKLLLLNDINIEVSIDDFGTGYSSLSYLKKLPIKELKIDKSFIDDIPHDNESSGIVQTIIALSKILNLDVIAEGVEDIKQKKFLLENGCENIQGYLYSKPLSVQEMAQLFSNHSPKSMTS